MKAAKKAQRARQDERRTINECAQRIKESNSLRAGSQSIDESSATQDKLLSIPQAAAMLGIKSKTCWNWVYLRRLPVVRLSRGCVRVSAAALEKMIARATVPAME
jgi:predicted DNA-binding transcriptional regulator AlpA